MPSPLGSVALRDEKNAERSAILAREADNGANTIAEMLARDELNATRRGWRATPCETTEAEALETPQRSDDAPDMRRVSIGRVYSVDLPAALRRYCAKRSKDERETLRTEALLLIARWSEQGTGERRMVLGSSDASANDPAAMSRRCDWLSRDASGRLALTDGAWRVMHAAILQSERTREQRQADAVSDLEESTPDDALGRLAQSESDALDVAPGTLPDTDAPDVLADVLGVSLNAARALIFRAYAPREGGGGSYGASDAARDWGITPDRVRRVLSEGRTDLLHAYPQPADLLAALRNAAPAYRERLAARATLALMDWRDDVADQMPPTVLARTRERAIQAAQDYRSATRAAPEKDHALELAALGAIRRATGSHAPDRAATLAQCVARQMSAETTRERRRVQVTMHGNGR